MINKIRKKIAVIMSMSIVFLFVMGTAYTIEHQHHDCDVHSRHEVCTVCTQIKKIQQTFQNLAGGKQATSIAIIVICMSFVGLSYCTKAICKITPIDLKVRMDN